MDKKQRKNLQPPKRHKVRGLCMAEGSPLRPQLLKIVSVVKNDKSLDLQIRDGYLNISLDLQGSAKQILGDHGAMPLFRELSDNSLDLVEYKLNFG